MALHFFSDLSFDQVFVSYIKHDLYTENTIKVPSEFYDTYKDDFKDGAAFLIDPVDNIFEMLFVADDFTGSSMVLTGSVTRMRSTYKYDGDLVLGFYYLGNAEIYYCAIIPNVGNEQKLVDDLKAYYNDGLMWPEYIPPHSEVSPVWSTYLSQQQWGPYRGNFLPLDVPRHVYNTLLPENGRKLHVILPCGLLESWTVVPDPENGVHFLICDEWIFFCQQNGVLSDDIITFSETGQKYLYRIDIDYYY